ncbi:hypothetical protein PCE1_001295 [Barthelona sp. PCE]
MGCFGSSARRAYYRKVVIAGLSNAGKTTLVKRLLHPEISLHAESAPPATIGIESSTGTLRGVPFNLVDLSGAKAFRFHWANYHPIADLIIFVIDAADYDALPEAVQVLKEQILDNEKLNHIPLLIVGNKTDKAGAIGCEQLSSYLINVNQNERTYDVLSTSAITGHGTQQVVMKLLEYCE